MTVVGDALSASPCLAVDIGASKVDVAVVRPDGSILVRDRLEVVDHPETLFDGIVQLARSALTDVSVDLVGVGCAGPMTRGGETVSPLNIPSWREFPLRAALRDALGLEVYVDGDARALALAEGAFGGALGQRSYLSMVVSTGVGGGIVLNGRLLDGETGNAGHIGHLNVVPNGALCSCGAYGCLEAEASGHAIEERTGQLVGRAVGTLASVLDFHHCYVAGSVALGYGDEFFDEATKAARGVAMLSYSHDIDIRRSGLGGDGPILGAALVAWRAES
ncbi:MAG TPA: ROK family protein [Acidimicrobiales bacterium]|nr:ROK family protein [Acidimicrobiales bacterium]